MAPQLATEMQRPAFPSPNMNTAAKSARHRASHDTEEPVSATWVDLKAKPLRRITVEDPYPEPAVEPVIKWTLRFHENSTRPVMLVVPGATAQDRLGFYRKYLSEEWASFRPDTVEDIVGDAARGWVDQTILGNFTGRLALAQVPSGSKRDLPEWFPPPVWGWEFVWALASVPTFLIEEPLRSMVDQSHYLFHEVYRVLWELRFRVRENKGYEPALSFFTATIRWLTSSALSQVELLMLEEAGVTRRISSEQERFDVLFFLIALAEHNALLNRYVVCFDGLERILRPDKRPLLRELSTFLATIDRWVRLAQVPVGVILGMDTSKRHMTQLRRLNPKLADDVETGLAWTRPQT